jgi:hypothetical protein
VNFQIRKADPVSGAMLPIEFFLLSRLYIMYIQLACRKNHTIAFVVASEIIYFYFSWPVQNMYMVKAIGETQTEAMHNILS